MSGHPGMPGSGNGNGNGNGNGKSGIPGIFGNGIPGMSGNGIPGMPGIPGIFGNGIPGISGIPGIFGNGIPGMSGIPGMKQSELASSLSLTFVFEQYLIPCTLFCFVETSTAKNMNHKQLKLRISSIKFTLK